MSVQMGCPSCGKRLKVPDAALGKKVRCSGCGEVIRAPVGISVSQGKQNPRTSSPSVKKKRKRPAAESEIAFNGSAAFDEFEFQTPESERYPAETIPARLPPAIPTAPVKKKTTQCDDCGGAVSKRAAVCPHCGAPVGDSGFDVPDRHVSRSRRRGREGSDKSRIAYVLLGLFLGNLGIHNFYAGYTNKGIIQLLLTLVSWHSNHPIACGFCMGSCGGVYGDCGCRWPKILLKASPWRAGFMTINDCRLIGVSAILHPVQYLNVSLCSLLLS